MSACLWRRSKDESYRDNSSDKEEGDGSEITSTERGKEQKKRRALGRFQKVVYRTLPLASHTSASFSSGKKELGSGMCCCICSPKPRVVEDDGLEKSKVDRDDPKEFGDKYLKSMVERNDFYSKECNTHVSD